MGVDQKMPEVTTTTLDSLVDWARKYSIYRYPFVTASSDLEHMSAASDSHDMARFGAEVPSVSPKHADLLLVVGAVNHKMAPYLRAIYEQMNEPRWVVALGDAASHGGPYDNYSTVQGVDKIIPVDVHIPGNPPGPEQILDGLTKLQQKIESKN